MDRTLRYFLTILPLVFGFVCGIAGELTPTAIFSAAGFVGLAANLCADYIVSAIRENNKKE